MKFGLMEAKFRLEASSLAKIIEQQQEAAVAEGQRTELAHGSVEAELAIALESGDDARAEASSAAEVIANQHQEELAENKLVQSTLEAELEKVLQGWEETRAEAAASTKTIARQHWQAFEEAKRFETTTEILQATIRGLTQTITLLHDTNLDTEESFLSTREMLEGEVAVAITRMHDADVRANGLEKNLESQRRTADQEAHRAEAACGLITGELKSSREDARAEAKHFEKASAEARRVILDQTRLQEQLELALQRWDDSRAEAASSAGVIARQQQEAFGEAGRFASTTKTLFETIDSLTDTVAVLGQTNKDATSRFMSAKHGFEGELAAAVSGMQAAHVRAEEMEKKVAKLERKAIRDGESPETLEHEVYVREEPEVST